MRDQRSIGRVEDYTGAFLVSFGVLVFCALIALWANVGYFATLMLALVADRWLCSLAYRSRNRNGQRLR